VPWSNELFDALGVRETIAAAGFVEKWGASFRTQDGALEQHADFATAVETPSPQTFQVLRERFDEVLLRHSERSGAVVLEGSKVADVAFDADGVTVRFVDADGGERTTRAGAGIGAPGKTGVGVKRVGRAQVEPP